MKILQVITDTDRRGAQVFALKLGAAMEDQGHTVSTVALAPGHQTNPLDVETLGETRRSPATLRALRNRMRQVDITIAHGSTTLFAAAAAGFPTNRFIYRQISDSKFWANTWRRRVRNALLLRRAARIVALPETAKRTLVEHVWAPTRCITVIPNGMPLGEFHPPTADQRQDARKKIGA